MGLGEGFWDALRILNGSNRVQSATAVCMVSVQRSKTAPSEVITGGSNAEIYLHIKEKSSKKNDNCKPGRICKMKGNATFLDYLEKESKGCLTRV